MIDKDVVKWLQSLLRETLCSSLEKQNGHLLLEFGHPRLLLQSSWRFIKGGDIVVGSCSIDFSSIPDLADCLVDSISIVNDFHDLRIVFDNGSVFETFADSEEFEHWSFHLSETEMLIAGPGKLWSSFLSPSGE